jgi:maltose-binding protein MalE
MPVPDPYHQYPLFAGLGGYVFGTNPDGTYDAADLGIDSPGGLRAAEVFDRWTKEGLVDPAVTNDVMLESFGEGEAPFAVTGPWSVSDPERGFRAVGVDFTVEPIPPVEGGTPRPFVRVLGFVVPAEAPNAPAAATFLLDSVATAEGQAQLAVAADRPPALRAALDDPSIGPDLRGFGLSAENGDPLPAVPEMAQVWGPWADAYASILQQVVRPDQAFHDAAAQIRAAIGTG